MLHPCYIGKELPRIYTHRSDKIRVAMLSEPTFLSQKEVNMVCPILASANFRRFRSAIHDISARHPIQNESQEYPTQKVE